VRTSRGAAIVAVTAGLMGGLVPGTRPMAKGAGTPAGAITIQTFQFQPAQLEVTPGSSVTWTNNDDIEHTVTAGTPDKRTGMFNTALNGKGKIASFTFTKAGTYGFFCDRHNFMHGEIVVK
jgi:plastocyanin